MHTRYILLSCIFLASGLSTTAWSQQTEKVTVNGAARAVFFGDELNQDLPIADTITAPKENSGHTLVDLGVNINPIKNIEIQGMVRVRNDFGGFWGSGITFDVRQLYVKGVIADIIRYQIGDIDYKLTPYTFYNPEEMITAHQPAAFGQMLSLVDYDLFFNAEGTRRQQGAATDFALEFNRYVRELQFNLFATRQQPGGNGVNERLFTGANITLIQSKYFSAGYNYVHLFDVEGTSKNPITFHNPVNTFTMATAYETERWKINADAEAGTAQIYYNEDPEAPTLNDYFADGKLKLLYKPFGAHVQAQYISIGPDFRSAGAQTKRLDYTSFPRAFDRITNDQVARPLTMLDMLRDAAVYNMRISSTLMAFDPRYDNITPYGTATPNRQGVTVSAGYSDKKQLIAAGVQYSMLSEIRGEGTTNLRNFSRVNGNVVLNAGQMIKDYKKLLKIELNMRLDQTERTSEGNIPAVDLKTNSISAGLEVETFSQIDVLFGWQSLQYNGFEFSPLRDTYGQIIYFSEYQTDGSEQMTGAGLRYRFSEKIHTSAMFNHFSYTENIGSIPAYTINTFAFIFKMDF